MNRGFTLIEMLLVLLFATLLAGMAHQVVRLAATAARTAQAERAATRDAVTVWALANHDLANANAADIIIPAGNALEYDRPVGDGSVCLSLATAVTVRYQGERLPDADRDVGLLRESAAGGDWLRRGIVSVVMANCPDGGEGLVLTLAGAVPAIGAARIVEPSRLRSYTSGGRHWLGLEPLVSPATIQPLAGPITPTGFALSVAGPLFRLYYHPAPLAPLELALPLEVWP